MGFLEFVQLLSDINSRVFIAYDDPKEEPQYANHIYSSIPGRKLWLPEGFKYDKETETINSTRDDYEVYNLSVYDIFKYTDIDAHTLANKIKELNGDIDIYGDADSNIIYGDPSLRDLVLPTGFRMKNPRFITHGDTRYKYVNTNKYKVTSSYNKYSKKHNNKSK